MARLPTRFFMSLPLVVALTGTSHAATLSYRFAFANVGTLGDVSGSVSFTDPSPLVLLTTLEDLDLRFDPAEPAFAGTTPNGGITGTSHIAGGGPLVNYQVGIGLDAVSVLGDVVPDYLLQIVLLPNGDVGANGVATFLYSANGDSASAFTGSVSRVSVPEPPVVLLFTSIFLGLAVRRRARSPAKPPGRWIVKGITEAVRGRQP